MFFLALSEDLKMFSLEHILAVLVVIGLILVMFFTRKFWMKNKTADMIFRISLGLLLIYSEFQIRFDSNFNKAPLVLRNIPIPLCGMLLWIAAIGLISDSERIIRKFYPIFLTAATLSLIMCDIQGANFPDFRAFQYFICHGGFLIGALYFVFTRKINKFTFKDYGWSCLIIGTMGGVMAFLFATNRHVFPDDFYQLGFGMDVFKPVYEACGQIGYTLIYVGSIALMMLLFTLVTWLLTRHRDDNINYITYSHNKFMDFINKKTTRNARNAYLSGTIIVTLYMIAWQAIMGNMSLDGHQDPAFKFDPTIVSMGWIIGVLWFLICFIFIINEMIHYYNLQLEREKNIKA